ncbi:MAG: CBS domain-containing protein [Planctomycetes bacterium]|nr:CBS domain-containing protein [Planctomycetota bacterium]
MIHALADLRASEIMTKGLVSLSADMPVQEAARALLERGISGAPVIDDDGRPIGVMTLTDLAKYAAESSELATEAQRMDFERWQEDLADRYGIDDAHLEAFEGVLVEQIMTPEVRAVPESATLSEVLDALLSGPYRRIFVHGAGGVLVGVVSALDALRAIRKRIDD